MEDTNTNTEPETPATVNPVETAMNTTFVDLFETVFGETWKDMELDDAITFRNTLAAYCAAGNMLREKFDADVWKGHSAGTVPTEIQSVRTRNAGKTPGKAAKPLTPVEILAKRLKK